MMFRTIPYSMMPDAQKWYGPTPMSISNIAMDACLPVDRKRLQEGICEDRI